MTAQTGQPSTEEVYDWADTVTANLEAFAEAAMGKTAYPFTLEEMVHNIEVLEAIKISAEDRKTVFIADWQD